MSIYGIGTDIVEVGRIALKLNQKGFIERVFTPNEISYCLKQANKEQHFAARFAAKEAYMKAMGSGWTAQTDFRDIEVKGNKNGAPYINLHGKAFEFFNSSNLKKILVSLSHTKQTAIAFVIIETGL
jgi:holo-[acyl-carrier protein] synthase